MIISSMKKVLLLTEGVSSYSRGIIHGVAEYSRLYGPWIFYREPLAYRKKYSIAQFSKKLLLGKDTNV